MVQRFLKSTIALCFGMAGSLLAQDKPKVVQIADLQRYDSYPNTDLPVVNRGTLLLCGGGDLPFNVVSAFHDAGQGAKGTLVVIPSASRLADSGDFTRWFQTWDLLPWSSIQILHANSREEADHDDAVAMLRRATAVWISGGDQRRLAERYSGSKVETEIRSVMERGGVVGGTSAGSAIATKVMISGGHKQPELQQGLDLLPRAIVDQHFSQRSRQTRLVSAIATHPDRVGIGIDESTGLFITAKNAQVLGQGSVYIFRSLNESKTEEKETKSDEIDLFANFHQKRFSAGASIEVQDLPFLGQ